MSQQQRAVFVSLVDTFVVSLNRQREQRPVIFFICLTTVMIIILDGALLFFVLVKGFDYLNKPVQLLLLEITIQIINAIFTILILIELPFRALNVLNGACMLISNRIVVGKIYFTGYPIYNSFCLLLVFCTFNAMKVFHAPIQCTIQYMLIYYSFVLMDFNALPASFGILVAVSLTLGATIGLSEILLSVQYSSSSSLPTQPSE